LSGTQKKRRPASAILPDLIRRAFVIEEMRMKSLRFITSHEGHDSVARDIGARKYLECSSLSDEGVDDVFESATRAALLTFEKGKGRDCCIIW
jgi:Rho family protein